jgi:hypothetical protein
MRPHLTSTRYEFTDLWKLAIPSSPAQRRYKLQSNNTKFHGFIITQGQVRKSCLFLGGKRQERRTRSEYSIIHGSITNPPPPPERISCFFPESLGVGRASLNDERGVGGNVHRRCNESRHRRAHRSHRSGGAQITTAGTVYQARTGRGRARVPTGCRGSCPRRRMMWGQRAEAVPWHASRGSMMRASGSPWASWYRSRHRCRSNCRVIRPLPIRLSGAMRCSRARRAQPVHSLRKSPRAESGVGAMLPVVWTCGNEYHAVYCAEAPGCADEYTPDDADTTAVQTRDNEGMRVGER